MKWIIGVCLLCCSSWLQADVYRFDSSRQIHFPPYHWYDSKRDSADGFFFMVAEAVADELEFSVRSVDLNKVPTAMPRIVLQRLENGEADFFFMAYREPSMAGTIKAVTPALINLETRIFVPKDSKVTFNQWSDLVGLNGGGFGARRVSGNAEFDRYAEKSLSIKPYPSFRALANALVAGEVDYIIAINSAIKLELYLLDKQEQFVTVGSSITELPIDWLISAKSPMAAKLKQIESTLLRFERSGRLKLIMSNAMKKYLAYHREQLLQTAD